jgi:hypothetical protein
VERDNMLIYEQEALDGLADKISQNTSVAFQCLVSKFESLSNKEEIQKSIAGFIEDGRNFDLYNISSILASVGDNKNDDWFLPEEIWAARHTPIFKQVNYGHNEQDIIGVITGTAVLDNNGYEITDELNISNLRDIVSHAVIWSYWEDDVLKSRFSKIVEDIENEKLFVSMESLFKNFDYMLIKDDTQSIVKRTKETSFLTKYLRIYNPESSGTYNGYRIYRLLRDFTFSGKALVENPANARSIISDSLNRDKLDRVEAKIITKSLAEKIMDPNEIALNAVKAELAQAKAELENYKQAEAEKTSAEINQLKASNEALQKQVAELTSVAQAAKEDMKKTEAEKDEEMKTMKDECEVKVAEANAKLKVLEAEKATAARLAKLTAVNVEVTKAEEILKTWASVDDDHFAKLVDIYAVAPQKTQETDFDSGLDTAKTSASTINPNGDTNPEKAVAKEKALAEKIANQFKFTKNKKGSK